MNREFFAIYLLPNAVSGAEGEENSDLPSEILPPPHQNETPPPARVISLRVSISLLDEFFSESLSDAIGLLFRGDIIISPNDITLDRASVIVSASKKLSNVSEFAKSQGVILGFFMNGMDCQERCKLHTNISLQIRGQVRVAALDVLGDHEGVKVFLEGMHHKAVFFDTLVALGEPR